MNNFDGTYTATDLVNAARHDAARGDRNDDDWVFHDKGGVIAVLLRAVRAFKNVYGGRGFLQFQFVNPDGVRWFVDVRVGRYIQLRQINGPTLMYAVDATGDVTGDVTRGDTQLAQSGCGQPPLRAAAGLRARALRPEVLPRAR